MAFHFVANSNALCRPSSKSTAFVPSSPIFTIYNGRFNNSEIASAVNVFPTPGGPYKRNIIPFPFPVIGILNVYYNQIQILYF